MRDAGVAKTPIASPLLNWDKILLSPRKHCVRGSKVISVRLPPKSTQSSPGTAETGPASASNKADDNNRSALSVKPSTDSGPMFRSDQSAKSSSLGLTTAIVDSRMELNFNTPAPRENVFRASNFDKSKSKKDKHKPLPKTLITSKSTAAGSQNERKKTTTHDLFERGKDVDLSSSAIRVNSEPKAGSQMEIKKPILNLFERGKDIDLSFSAIRANPPAKAEALFHFEPPTNIDSEAVTLFSSLFDEPVITFCDDFPYSENSANKRQTTSADGPEKAPFGADNSSEGSFSTPELGPMHDSREGNFAKMIAHSCIDDDSSDSDASFYSLDGPTSPAEAA